MKRAFSIFVLIILTLNIVGWTVLYLIMQNEAKEEMINYIKEGDKEKEIELLVFNEPDFYSGKEVRIVNNKEFIYKSSIYDIVRKESKDGKLYIWCINDTKETSLIKHFHHNQDNENSSKNSNIKHLKIFSIIALLQNNCYSTFINNYETTNYYPSNNYNSIILEKISPPPKYIFS